MMNSGNIHMGHASVLWVSGSDHEKLSLVQTSQLICPNWTITRKYNLLPGRTADSDNWLEPGEQFEILACPSTGVKPYGIFTLIIHSDGSAMPLRLTRMVPSGIAPVMSLR